MSARMLRPRTRQQLRPAGAVMVCIALLTVSCSDGDSRRLATDSSREPTDAEVVRYGAAAGAPGYTEEEIGVDFLVDEYFADNHILANYRTYEDHDEATFAEDDFRSLSVEERDRVFFEQHVSLLFLGAEETAPPEVEAASDELWRAFYESLDLCTAQSSWPDVILYGKTQTGHLPVTAEQFASYQQQYGMTSKEFTDFEHECNKFAATYPALEREHRDELLNTRRDYYLEVLRLWMQANPEVVVPMTYEQSVNHPYQDYVREICQTTDDPQECARSEGVTLE